MSERQSPGGSAAFQWNWSMRCVLVNVPSYSAICEDGRKNTSVWMSCGLTFPLLTSGAFFQKVAVSVSQLSFTTSHWSLPRPLRSRLAWSDVAGFWPMQYMPLTRPSAMAANIAMCEWSPRIRGCQPKPKSFSGVAAAPYMDLRYDTMNFGVLAQKLRASVVALSQSSSVSCLDSTEGCGM